MNRRHFISGTAALAALGMGFKSGLLAQGGPVKMPERKPETPKTEFVSLRRNVGIFNGRGGTIGWLSSAEALAIVDTQFPNTAQICLDGLPARDGRMIDVVINTHHHGDHTSGNPVFRPVAKKLVAQENVPALMRGRAIQDKKPVEDLVIADTTFADTWKMELGDEVVSARYFGPAHTKGDIAVLFEKANVVHVGDLLFNRIYPVIDRPGGASLAGWIQRLETIQKEYPADALYVGGHGNPKFGVVAKRGELAVFRDYLSALLDYTQKAIDAGRSKAEIVTLENFPGFADFHLPLPNRLSGNLSVAYDELTAAKG